jgi:hypothetical protein
MNPDRIAIGLDGTVVVERHDPRNSFAGYQTSRPWDSLQNTLVTKAGMLDRVKAFSGCSHPPPSA